jgi:hypothetical protein
VAPIFGAAPLYIKKAKKWQMPLIMRPGLVESSMLASSLGQKALETSWEAFLMWKQ